MQDIELSAFAVNLVVSVFIPILTGILTKVQTSSWVKGVVTLFLNGVNALVTNAVLADGTALLSKEVLVTFILGFVVSVATYSGIYKPAGVSSSDGGKLSGGGVI